MKTDTLYKDGSFEILTKIHWYSDKESYTIAHACPKRPAVVPYFRTRERAFRVCSHCRQTPSEGLKTIFMLLIAEENYFPEEQ